MGVEKFTVISLASTIPTEADAYRYLEELRWHGRPVCPHCGSIDRPYFLTPKNGISRETASGKASERRIWKCGDCRKKFTATTGTVMHGSHVPLRIWLFVFFEMAGNKNGIAAREVSRKYGVNPRTAWHLTQRIREAMGASDDVPFAGNVVVDETYIGGSIKNRHAHDPRGFALRDKVAVVSVIDSDTGRVHSTTIPTVRTFTLRLAIAKHVDMPVATLHTDSLSAYLPIGQTMAAHHRVDHSAGEYATEKSHGTNAAENYFSQLKRSIDGTFHHVSRKHLNRYLAEFDYRLSTCDESDADRMSAMVQRTAGRRLSYDSLRGRHSLVA